jgi:hypothetical protein
VGRKNEKQKFPLPLSSEQMSHLTDLQRGESNVGKGHLADRLRDILQLARQCSRQSYGRE